jgi:hypothetical protein
MSLRAYTWANQLNLKSLSKKAVLLVLSDFAVETLKTYPSMSLIQKTTGMTEAQVEYALNGLVEDKIILDTGKRVGEQGEIRVFKILPITEVKKLTGRVKTTNPELLKYEEIYRLYPRPVAKPQSLAKIAAAVKKYGFDFIKERTMLFAAAWKGRTDLHLCPHSATWYHQERFSDDPKTWNISGIQKFQSIGPKFPEVREYVIQHMGSDSRGWASSFYGHWNSPSRNWKDKKGKPIDWKEALSKQLSIWRAAIPPAT